MRCFWFLLKDSLNSLCGFLKNKKFLKITALFGFIGTLKTLPLFTNQNANPKKP
jgi:hypothetical protein